MGKLPPELHKLQIRLMSGTQEGQSLTPNDGALLHELMTLGPMLEAAVNAGALPSSFFGVPIVRDAGPAPRGVCSKCGRPF
jgi:hypothetical protein